MVILSLALAGCGLVGSAPTATSAPTASSTPAPSPQPSATLLPADTATLAPAPSATDTATFTPATATAIATPSASSTVAATEGPPPAGPSPTATSTSTTTGTQATGTDKADFVADVTVPDGTTFTSGQAFVKTWQLKNAGTNTWTSAYALAFVRGDQMGGPASVPLSGTVAPGATTEISVNLAAPTKLGSFTGFWMLRNAAGKLFGLSADANQPVYLKINVGAAAGTPQPTAAPGGLNVTAASLGVDPPSFTGACPHTYILTGTLTSSGAGTISYQLEASSDQQGFVFNLPAAVDAPFTDAGPRTFSVRYELNFTGLVGGQAWLHVLAPNDLSSGKVNFSLTCQP
jgi:hypothetical protein